MNLIFMRHGMPDIEPDSRRCIGQTDYPLSPYGRKQMEESAVRLKNIYTPNIIYCSPLLRCIQSVCILSQFFCCGIYFAEGLAEIHMGEWENLTFSAIKERYPLHYEERGRAMADHPAPRGETFREVQTRANAMVCRATADADTNDTILFVTHIGVIRSLLCLYENRPLDRLFDYSLGYGDYLELN